MIMPFTVPVTLFLDVADFKADATLGEITFRLGAITSAISNKDHDPSG
jgi:hypothetical protein